MMRKLLATVALLVAVSANAGQVEYDRRAGPQQDVLASLLVRTVDCMRGAVKARLTAGVRDEDDIAQWAATTCGVALGHFMVREMAFAPIDAAAYLFAMGHAAIDETPGITRRGR